MKKLAAESTSWKETVGSAGVAGAEGVITTLHVDPANEAYRRLAAQCVKIICQVPNEALASNSAVMFFGNVVGEFYQICINLIGRDAEVDTSTLVMDRIACTQVVPPDYTFA